MEDESEITLEGLNGFPIVDGATFYDNSSFYSFATSHSLLLNVWNWS